VKVAALAGALIVVFATVVPDLNAAQIDKRVRERQAVVIELSANAAALTYWVVDADGWFNTGDLARFDGDILYIVGRTKELIIRSCFNIYPAEVETVLNENPAVQSAVVGRAGPGNEEIIAFVQLLPGGVCAVLDALADPQPSLCPMPARRFDRGLVRRAVLG
jgi:acyl-CoA synthetase (AMP-forming)/AMP-acid ligase II